MKTRSQKLISLVLVLMMLVTMIPAGFFGASAVSAELAAGLADYASTTEFVINNVEDWEAVSALGKGFDGRTVKLGADIDAEGGSLPMLFPNGFGGTFDGQGYTVKNVNMTSTGATSALFTHYMATGAIRNVNLDNVNITVNPADDTVAANVSLVLTKASVAANSTVTIENINVTNSTVTNNSTHASSCTAGIVAQISVNDATATAIVRNINAQGLIKGSDGHLGGIVGTAAAAGLYKFENIHAGMNLFDTDTEAPSNGTSWADAGVFAASLQINSGCVPYQMKNIYVTGNLEGGHNNAAISGFVGYTSYYSGGGDLATWENIVIASSFTDIWGNNTIATEVKWGEITATNTYTTMTTNGGNHAVNGKARWTVMSAGASGKVNGLYQGWAAGDAIAPAFPLVSANIAAGMVQRDAKGFITEVTAPNPLDMALEAFSTTTEFVINSASDWNKIAAYSAANSSQSWSKKTIKLGADIVGEVDANGAPTTVLNQLSPVQFYGTFDGCGYTIKNVKAGGNTFFTAKIDGTTFKNVTFDNILVAASSYSGIFTGIVNDWASSTFSNITVKNSTVTSASGDSGMFCAIVDNKAGTLSFTDITIENSALLGGSHTGIIFGSLQTQNADTNLVIDGITMNNVTVTNKTDANLGGLIGWVRPNGTETTAMTIKNVNITGIKVSSGECYATGGLIGRTSHNIYNIALENINIAGSVTTTSTADTDYIGGVIGKIEAAGTVSVQKLYSNMTVTSTTAQKLMIGGFCAYVGVASGKQFVMEDSYIGGAVVANTAHSTSTAGVINKVAGTEGEDIANISNIVVNVDMSQAAGNAVTILGVHGGNVLLSKCYSVTASNGGVAAGGKVRWSFMSHNGASFINGVANPWTSSDVAGDKFVTIITAKAAAMMAKKNADGFVAGVYTTTASAYQASAVSNEKFAVRFIAFDFMGDATNISMNVIARVQGGVSKSFTADCTMYDALTAYHAQGITSTYRADAFDAKAIAGFTIYNIPTGAAIDFTVTVTYTTADGTFSNVMNLSFDANGLCTTSPMAN